jgi:hypothetical protein
VTYIDTCRRRIATLDGTELTPTERGEMRAIAGSREVPADVAAAAAALLDPIPEVGAAAGFKRGLRRGAEAATSNTYRLLEN